MSGEFRKTGAPSTAGKLSVVDKTVNALRHGQSVSEYARSSGLPRDFVEQIVEYAREQGRLDFVSLSPNNGCASGSCTPDPESLVCASCPLAPSAKQGRTPRMQLLHHLKRLWHSRRNADA
ncbi:hypothetical protein [Bifidobacterium canis]|uniref:hypothetical protein n=1 Tax=Bifidobacterium canis TaxID=2610880 RepID=UPI001FE9FA13|nr:hypothetical protein [Bifidobacterium canis]